MTVGASLFLVAVGAILRYAVTAHVEGVNLDIAGLVLMIVGVVGLVIGLFLMFSGRDRATVPPPRPPERY
jgi:hypothetical protein